MIAGVPPGLRRQVLNAFVNAIRTSPKLANNRVIKTWLVWDGKSPITVEPTTAQLPAIQIRMLGGPVTRLVGTRAPGAAMTHDDVSKPTMIIELWTPGTDAGDQADVADLIYQALAPQDQDQRAQLMLNFRKAGIKDWQLTREILPASAESFAAEAIVGQGSYELTVFFHS